jgi:hypothetical protein
MYERIDYLAGAPRTRTAKYKNGCLAVDLLVRGAPCFYNNFIEYTEEDNEKEIIDNYKYITNELKVLIKSSKSI